MRIVVIGGAGFIGDRLVGSLLADGHDVSVVDLHTAPGREQITTVSDVRDRDALTKAFTGANVVINLAAVHRDDVRPLSLYESVNVDGARAIADAATAAGVSRIVFTSSVAVYGLDGGDASESTQPRPFNEYGRTKLAAEQVFTEWAHLDESRALLIVRPSVVFGEGNRGNVYTLARQLASGRFLLIGNGRNRKSMTYVGNLVSFLSFAVDHGPGVVTVNYADKPDLTTSELIAELRRSMGLGPAGRLRVPLPLGLMAGFAFDGLARLTGRTFPISRVRVQKFVAETTVNTDRLSTLGFTPPFTIAEGLRRTIDVEFPVSERGL